MLRFDGVSWRSLTLPGQSRANLRGVAGNSISSDVCMVGAGAEIFRYVKPHSRHPAFPTSRIPDIPHSHLPGRCARFVRLLR